ncbi:MAG: peptidoglycan-binding protein [Hyphomicrobiales bacterium]|jgi:localization factor PodJL
MAQQSQNAWQSPTNLQPEYGDTHAAAPPSVGEWMQNILGRNAPEHAISSNPSLQPVEPVQPAAPAHDLQSRLAAIAKNIETLESKVVGDAGPVAAPESPAPISSAPMQTAAQPAPASSNPLDALRRRKYELEHGVSSSAPVATSAPAASQPVMPEVSDLAVSEQLGEQGFGHAGLDQLVARLDDQFARLTDAVSDVRNLAESSAVDQRGLHAQVAALQSRVETSDEPGTAQRHEPEHGYEPEQRDETGFPEPSLTQLSDQIRAVQDTIAAMPKPEAIKSLEDGYHHVLARLDDLKDVGTSDEKIDALYGEVTSLREVLDNLGENTTSSLVGEMRSMISQLEINPHGDADRITQALESVKEMARSAVQDPDSMNEAIGAVVERLVALEARIEALASGADDSAVTQRLDAIQSEMARLSTFQDEARGLTSALDTIREEMRATSSPAVDVSAMDQRFSALDRIEAMTGGYAEQVAELSQRLNALDGRLASHGDMASELAALSRQLNGLSAALPVHEIEHALLDLTGRVTALQEDDGTERLGLAVRELGERVESCLKSIPKTEAIIQAVEAKIDSRLSSTIDPVVSRLDGVDERLDGIQRAISAADAPLIDHMSNRLEGLIAAMPTPLADVALASLESQLVELNKRHAEAGVVSREDVTRLHNELARARASVELGSNRDLQRSIVDQVRHLAGRFDEARSIGDAGLLPEIETQIDDLANRVHSLGLFDPQSEIQDALGMQALQSELVSLREHASDQDQRMLTTLENVQSALEKVISRIDALETDDKAALNLAADSASDTGAKDHASATTTSSLEEMAKAFDARTSVQKPDLGFDLREPEKAISPARSERPRASADENKQPLPSGGVIPAPGDAQTLLRQLSGAINAAPERSALAPQPYRDSDELAPANAVKGSGDTTNQRATFIAAARRAAQAAALQAGGGRPAVSDPNVRGTKGKKSGSLEPPAHATNDAHARQEPALRDPLAEPPIAAPTADSINVLDSAADSARQRKSEKQADEAQRQRSLSRAMLIALVLFTIGLGLFVVNLILPGERASDAVLAPLAPTEAPATPQEDQGAQSTPEVGAASDEPVRVVGNASETVAADPVTTTPAIEDFASTPNLPTPNGATPAEETIGRETALGGFARDRGPIMAETPQVNDLSMDGLGSDRSAAQDDDILPPPANDLGPLRNLPIPPLPAATADSLPEAIGSPRLRVAAASGDASAAFEIATRFMEGRFVSQDLAAAAHWYGRAADQGLVPAAYRLGSFYEQGRGVDRNRDGAIAWYERAALGGNPRAMHNLAVMAAEGAGQSPDFSRAAGWFIPAANRGLADSQFNLAVLFARGMGVERDLMESYKWFALAANGGDNEAVGRRDEVAGVLGEQALALARARVDSWRPVPVESAAIAVQGPAGGWDDSAVQASASQDASASQRLIAEAQALLAERGYNPGPADGLLGPRTNEAVREFRQSVGLGNSDVIDQALLDALRQGVSL